MKTLWIDTETTGLVPEINKIVELACIFDDGKSQNEFHEFIKYPEYPEDYDRVVELTGLSREILAEKGKDPKVVFLSFIAWLDGLCDKFDKTDKMMIAGYSVKFDDNFLRHMFLDNQHKYFGSYFMRCTLDVMSILAMCIERGIIKAPESYKLEDIAKGFGIEFKSHSATEDIQTTKKLYEILLNKIREACRI